MEIWIAEQWKTIAESCIMGLIFGAGYDIIRVLQVLCGIRSKKAPVTLHPGKAPFWLYLACDLLYMLTITIASSIFLSQVNHGILRWYLVLPCIAGLWLYQHTIGRITMAISETCAAGLRFLMHHLVLRPFRWIIGLLRRLLARLFGTLSYGIRRQLCLWSMHRQMRHFSDFVKI